MNFVIYPIVVFLLLFVARPATSAESEDSPLPEKRPRIGVVLGGGGARGAAHIGVLRELERLRVPIDAIAGTSMGAIVGSLYAAGKSPDELEELVRSIDWADAFLDTPTRRDLSFRRKQDDAEFPIPLEIGLRDGDVLLPKGLIQGQKLQRILNEQLLHVSQIRNFDELAIPFRAVASDIETGELYVMSEGDLVLAARASMSAPGIFAPVTVDGHTLVDGGLVGNVPVDVVRAMDVDIVIAVDVEFPLYQPGDLQSALDITGQMLTIMIRRETRRQLATLDERDILIRPELGEYGSTNFAQIADVIEPGSLATQAVAHQLAAYSLSAADYQAFLARQRAGTFEYPVADFVRVRDEGPFAPGVLEARLKTVAGERIDPVTLAEDTSRLYGLATYEIVDYDLVQENGRTGVVFVTRTKSWGPKFIKAGLSLEDDFEGATAVNVSGRLTLTGLNSLGAEWRNDLQLGTDPHLRTEFYQPLSFDSRYFIAPRINLGRRNFSYFGPDGSDSRYRLAEAEFGLDAGREFGQWGELRIGAYRGTVDGRLKTGDPVLSNFDSQEAGVFARLSVDTLDDAQVPREGVRARFEWNDSRTSLGAEDDADYLSASMDKVWSWGNERHHRLQAGFEYHTTFDAGTGIHNLFQLGGFLRLSGLERGAISGSHAALARLLYYREIRREGGGFLSLPLYLGASVEAGNAWQQRSDISVDSLNVNGSLFAGVDTWFGLLMLGAGFAEGGESSYFLFLGTPNY